MILLVQIIILCSIFFVLCFLATGTDEKNLRSYDTYPKKVQDEVNIVYNYKNKEKSKLKVFISNFFLFLIVLFIFGFFTKEKSFINNFICLSILGQSLNLFDLIVIDLLWWRNTKRIRFSKISDKELYQDKTKHFKAFIRALFMFELVSLVDAFLLTIV